MLGIRYDTIALINRKTNYKRTERFKRAKAMKQQTMTVEEYFQLEENDPDTRYEYVDGYVYAMAEQNKWIYDAFEKAD